MPAGDHLTTVVGAIAVERPSLEAGNVGPKGKTGYVRPADVRVRYSILERPPWHETCLLGFQVSSPPPRSSALVADPFCAPLRHHIGQCKL